MPRKNVHVVPHGGQWAVRRPGSTRVSSIHPTQKSAIEKGRDVAINNRGELVIHGQNGQIRNSNSYGNDPCPPRDTKH